MNQRSEYSRREFVAASAPLFRDPIFDGASDPVIIWNRQEKNWWLLYTQRRANVWVHGCDIGVARSVDSGLTWRYLGALPGVERLPSGQWRMWYKDEAHNSHTWAADSPDLNHWTVAGEAIGGRGPGMPAPPHSVARVEPYATRRTPVQVAPLTLEGTELRCPRDKAAPFGLRPGVDNWSR